MLRIQRMPGLPENIGEFVAEVADELEVLYGVDAADHYRRVAIPTLSATIEHPLVDVLGACDGARTVGMLFGFVRDAAARITFLHVLRDHAGLGVEGRLVRESVRTFQAGGVDAIVAEYVAFGATRLEGAFAGLDFSVAPRQIMMADVRFPALALSGPAAGRALTSEEYGDAAAVVVDAYVGHADRRVHLDARDEAAARTFVETAAGGSYGPVFPGFLRGIWVGPVCAGVILASEPMPGIGFILRLRCGGRSRDNLSARSSCVKRRMRFVVKGWIGRRSASRWTILRADCTSAWGLRRLSPSMRTHGGVRAFTRGKRHDCDRPSIGGAGMVRCGMGGGPGGAAPSSRPSRIVRRQRGGGIERGRAFSVAGAGGVFGGAGWGVAGWKPGRGAGARV
ncbi:MAG TPA: hypothetical protein PKZ01_00105 [Candidatus Hydrogenedentes bacterium]|nr:hypothetical protein [Candidatus Hydrogenedentota bacterium]